MSQLKKEGEKILKDLAKNSEDPEKFRKIVEAYDLDQEKGNDKTTLYYSKLAENYALKIKKKELEKSSELFPHSLKDFEIGDNLEDYDPFNSYGEIIPGISKKWVKKEGFTYGKEKET